MTTDATASDRAATVEAGVLSATERLLAAGTPFAALSMQRIADEAGVARSTLYLYFKEKNAVLVRLTAGLKVGAYERMKSWSPTAPDALTTLTATLLDVIRYYRGQAHILRAALEMADQSPEVGRFWTTELTPFQQLSESWIKQAQAADQTTQDINPAIASQVIVHGGIRVIAHQALTGPPSQDEPVARELAANQWHGAFRRPT